MDVDIATSVGMDPKSSLRSCTTCSKAKAKCVRQEGQEVCERCARLKKECFSREPVLRRRKGVVKTTRAAQLEKLEHKIEHLVNALSTTQAQRGYSIDLGQYSPVSQGSERTTNNRQTEVLNSLCESMEEASDDPPISIPTTTPTSSSIYTTSPSQLMSPSTAAVAPTAQIMGLSISEADLLVDRYSRLLAPTFPFVKFQAPSVQQLCTDSPMLLNAIVTVAMFHDYPKQQIMVKQLIRDICERVLINGQKSLDVLQCVLVLVAWFHPHVFTMPQLTNLLHIAQALTLDLGIDRPPQSCSEFRSGFQKHSGNGPPQGPHHRQQATMDEHRALAGTVYLTSMLASSFKRLMAMRRTKYLDEALNTLEQAREHESDLFLVQMVRLQFLADDASTMETASAPLQVYVKSFQVDLERLRKNDPCKHVNNVFLRLQYKAVEILVWELSLNELQENSAKPLRPHVDNLCQCVKAIKEFIDIFFTIPASSYLTLPFSFFGQFAHAFIALIKLASLEVDGWDMRDLHDQLNFSEVIDEVANRYENGSKAGPDGLSLNNECFMKWATRVRLMKQIYESKFMQDGEAAENRAEAAKAMWSKQPPDGYNQPTPAQQQPTPADDMLSGDFFNYLDDNFWQSFAGDGFDLGLSEMAMT